MSGWLAANQGTIDNVLLNACLALSQYIALRAGVFSVAPVGVAAIGAYFSGILTVDEGTPFVACVAISIVAGVVCSMALGALLSRLRGVYQALATVGFVVVLQTVILNTPDLTGGVFGTNGIPKHFGTGALLAVLVVVIAALSLLGRGRLGRAFDAIRQDEMAAAANGIDVYRHQMVSFVLSGAVAGLAGSLLAFHNFSVVPSLFDFNAVINVLAFAVLGGIETVAGAVVGALFLTVLPELARPLADNRNILEGLLLIAVMSYLPRGIIDSLRHAVIARRRARLRTEPVAMSAAGAQPVREMVKQGTEP